ncbi:FimD/PapC C-terminal domain-containing protein, partial [Klebsiella michiganensis]
VFLSGMREQGAIVVTWGRQSSQQCRADFSLPKQSTYAGITEVSASCHQER